MNENKIQKIENIRTQLNNLGFITPYKINTYIDIIKSSLINKDDIETLLELSLNNKILTVKNQDFVELIIQMYSQMRERTHGAAILNEVIISKKLYSILVERSGSSSLTIYRVKITPCENPDYDEIIGLCSSKFEIPYHQLLVIGKLEK